jgi:hypothetical protein
MLKSAARRVGVVQEETGAVVVSRPSRALRALSWAIGRAGRVMRLGTRFIRLRF